MTFYNSPNFPDDISYGSKGGPQFNTTVLRMRSGHEQRNANWLYPLHLYDVSYGVKTQAQMASLREFFMAMLGRAHTFRFKDWHDYTTHSDGVSTPSYSDVYISAAVSSTSQFQLRKLYSMSSAVLSRDITKPVSATVSCAVNGYEVPSSMFTVDVLTGVFTLTKNENNPNGMTFGTSTLIQFPGAHGYAVGGTVYVSGVAQPAAINGQRYLITAVPGSAQIRIDLNSTGWSTYTTGGVFDSGIQASESATVSVTAGCTFDVPCRFDSDVFDPVHDDYNITNVNIQVVEVRD